jgi:hypothetical protein
MQAVRVDDGTVIRLFDPRRNPPDWSDLIGREDCAVFLKDRTDSTALGPDGRPYAELRDCTCVVFQTLNAAQRFCESKVLDLPHVRCEIYDKDGPLHSPMLVILHPEFQLKEDSGPVWSRRRRLIMSFLAVLAIPLFWFGSRGSTSSDFAIFLGINCLLLALRFLYWHAGTAACERKRRERLEAHRKLELGDA